MDVLLANSDKQNLNLPKIVRPVYLISRQPCCHFYLVFLEGSSQYFCILVYNFFIAKCNRSRCWSRWETQYRFQPIKFVNLVVPSPDPHLISTWFFFFLLKMSAVERYAIRFLESSGNYITLEQIKAAKVSKTLLFRVQRSSGPIARG